MKTHIIDQINALVKDQGFVILSSKIPFAHAIWFDYEEKCCFLSLPVGNRRLDELSRKNLQIIVDDLKNDWPEAF